MEQSNNPVYGFGVVFFVLILHPFFDKNWYIILILSMVVGGGFEFLSSCFQQYATGTVSWQYQQMPLNLYGRTSLVLSFYWGVLGLSWVKIIDPLVSTAIKKTPLKIEVIVTSILSIFMIFDMIISFLAVKRWDERINNIPANSRVEEFLDNTYPNSVLEKIYPDITLVSHS
ncbi:hypothetical protein GH810_04225 [Acetobacterium paludosum]|uniref:ABC transporter permease n=1 Tax=Acetobacterium paludosum TaxID=52693 RepID=A0A923KVI6_9FIRM|nr:putative ABC transporter permease [Acetobacterium paludosum]MBC3887510.1 hypothetical protein [Acetobacterium paludosum]